MFKNNKQVILKAITVVVFGFFASHALAQETVSGLKGIVADAQGAALSGSIVTIHNENSGLTRSTTTNDSGEFFIRNLPVGDDYTVTVNRDGYTGQKSEGLSLNLGQTASVEFGLNAVGESTTVLEELLVVGVATVAAQVAVGPSAVFGLDTIETVPAINRNITDIIRADARVHVDESRGGINSVQCGGKNSRFNSYTLDGVKINDSFGLNSNGYPTERIPFSYDAIQQVAVELAPFDVEYGGFTACAINSVTKSGGNEFHGGFFYDYTSDSLRGDSLEGDPIASGDFSEKRYGFNVGGSIIEDKLFFFATYEKLEGANLFDRGPTGSGSVNEIDVTQAELDEITGIARDLYQYDPGPTPTSTPHDDEKILVKLDWNVNDQHRAAFTYIYNDGFNVVESDGDSNEFEFQNHLYKRSTELTSYSTRLYSDWTDQFSSEIRVGYLDIDNGQNSVGGTDFGEIRVELDNVDVYLGGDDSRQSNKLKYDNLSFALKGNYVMNNGHNLTFGYEREDLEVFNLFVQHSETEIRFRGGIDAFRAGTPSAIYYNNAPSNNPDDAAAVWGYASNTVYFQDEFDVNDRLSVTAGLRYDWYTTDDAPLENTEFTADYGFSNATNLDGEGLIQPRVAFTFDMNDATTIRGGIGLFSGGDPNVWLSNNFSANNVLQFGQRGGSFGYTDGSRSLFDADVVYEAVEDGAPNGPGYGIPSELFNAVAAGDGGNFELNYLDPGFEIPSEWKFSLGTTWASPADYIWNADLLITKGKDTAIVLRGDLEQTGVDAQGYPQYDSPRIDSFFLTNSSVGNEALSASFSVSKSYDNGLDFTLGYAYTDAEDISPMASSVAFSNYTGNRAFFDPQEEVLSTSNYNIKNRVTLTATYRRVFWDDNMTTVSVFGSYNSGAPYSRAFDGTASPYGFTPFLDFANNVLEPGSSRNAFEGPSWTKLDVKVEQEIPGFRADDKAKVFLVIDNFTNLLNDDWGVLYQAPGSRTVALDEDTPTSRIGDASRYEIRLGIEYDF